MPYAKADLFIDVKTQIILDFSLVTHREHDVKAAEKIFKRNEIKNIIGLGDGGYDSENLHEIARANGITFYAPVRKMHRFAYKHKKPSGKYRRQCVNMPEYKGMRSLSETVNSVLKRTQIQSLRSKKHFMREREFGWQIICYNLNRIVKIFDSKGNQTFFICSIKIYSIRTEPGFT